MTTCDFHVHLALDGCDWKTALARHGAGPDREHIAALLQQYADAGVTFLRDGGDPVGVSSLAAEMAPDYGVTVISPCFPIYRKGRYGKFIGRSWETITDYRSLVAEVKQQGGSFIKLMLSGILDFSQYGRITSQPLTDAEMCELVSIAHGEGFAVMAHVNGNDSIRSAVLAGVDSVEHGYYAEADTLQLMAKSGVVWVPTLSPVANLMGTGRYPDDVLWRIAKAQAAAVGAYADMGGTLACGSDAGAVAVPHPAGAASEWEHLSRTLGARTQQLLDTGAEAVRSRFM